MTDSLHKPALDPARVEPKSGSLYPRQFLKLVEGRSRRKLGDPLGLRDFGVNLTELMPGAASALRHWHKEEDEFIFVVSGELTLITDEGEQVLRPGQCAGFPKGVANGHHLVNRSNAAATYLEVGSRQNSDEAFYSDVDMTVSRADMVFRKHDGSAYE